MYVCAHVRVHMKVLEWEDQTMGGGRIDGQRRDHAEGQLYLRAI